MSDNRHVNGVTGSNLKLFQPQATRPVPFLSPATSPTISPCPVIKATPVPPSRLDYNNNAQYTWITQPDIESPHITIPMTKLSPISDAEVKGKPRSLKKSILLIIVIMICLAIFFYHNHNHKSL